MATPGTHVNLDLDKSSTKSLSLFDAHNHIHMSLKKGIPMLLSQISQQHFQKHLEEDHDLNYDSTEFTIAIQNHASDVMTSLMPTTSRCSNNNASSDNHETIENENMLDSLGETCVDGMAIMSTQPCDFNIVEQLVHSLQMSESVQTLVEVEGSEPNIQTEQTGQTKSTNHFDAIPCFGVHPWFLKQANEEFDHLLEISNNNDGNKYQQNILKCLVPSSISSPSYSSFLQSVKEMYLQSNSKEDKVTIPSWLPYLYHKIQCNPKSHIGEIGLDNARYDPITKEIICPMESQINAFEMQLHLASHLHKSVSVHSVRCWGIFFESLRNVKKQRQLWKKQLKLKWKEEEQKRRNRMNNNDSNEDDEDIERSTTYHEEYSNFHLLPPRIYMHAFGGNPSIVDQVNAICCKDNKNSDDSNQCEVFYGFAPIINFRSPKTADTIRKVGINQLVLESDLEDYSNVAQDLKLNVRFVANALGLEFDQVLDKTNHNAKRLYTCV